MLRYDSNSLGIALNNLTYFIHGRVARLQRYRRGHRGADPKIALLELRQELQTQRACAQDASNKQYRHAAQCKGAVGERDAHDRHIGSMEPRHEPGVLFLHLDG